MSLSLDQALTLLKAGQAVDPKEVNTQSGKVSSVDALRLYRIGIEVSEEQIYYDDSQIAYDPDFDEEEWGDPQPAGTK